MKTWVIIVHAVSFAQKHKREQEFSGVVRKARKADPASKIEAHFQSIKMCVMFSLFAPGMQSSVNPHKCEFVSFHKESITK